jgi:predicted RNase H-like nuclease (RuvC/YqgF family)
MAEHEILDIKVDVEVLKTQVTTLTKLCEKMDTVIEKLVDHQGVLINQIYDDMDRRKKDSDEDIKDLYNRVNSDSKDLNEKLDKTEEKITNKLEMLSQKIQHHTDSEDRVIAVVGKYKWLIMSGVVVISWLTSHVGPDTILKIISP